MLRLTPLLFALLLALSVRGQQYQLKPEVAYRAETSEVAPILGDVQQTLHVQRRQLEPLLTTADKQQIAALRVAYRDFGNRIKTQQYDFQSTESTSLIQQARLLAQKYEAPITRLLAELAPQRQQWHAQLRAVEQKYAAIGVATNRPTHHHMLLDTMMDPVQFILLDPNRFETTYVRPFRFM